MSGLGYLSDVLRYEPVASIVDLGVLAGLSGPSKIDYIIGVIEHAREDHPQDELLQKTYARLQQDFPAGFAVSSGKLRQAECREEFD